MRAALKNNKYEIDMCNGTIMDKLISFAFPLMLSGILQLMFNAVDIIVVGRFSGSQALAAVGSTTALINVFLHQTPFAVTLKFPRSFYRHAHFQDNAQIYFPVSYLRHRPP